MPENIKPIPGQYSLSIFTKKIKKELLLFSRDIGKEHWPGLI